MPASEREPELAPVTLDELRTLAADDGAFTDVVAREAFLARLDSTIETLQADQQRALQELVAINTRNCRLEEELGYTDDELPALLTGAQA